MDNSTTVELVGNPSPSVQAKRLSVNRGKSSILRNLNFTLRQGSIIGLLGPSGCGKTTLMRTIAGLQQYQGNLEVLGSPAGSKRTRGKIGYVTQSPSLYPDLSIMDNLSYFADISTNKKKDLNEDIIVQLDLEKVKDQKVSTLSGGQKGRASLGCALVCDPSLLVMDEPTVGLDPVLRVDLWQRFRKLANDGKTLLVSSHVMDEANHCDEIIVMREGKIIFNGTPATLLTKTATKTFEEAFLIVVASTDTIAEEKR